MKKLLYSIYAGFLLLFLSASLFAEESCFPPDIQRIMDRKKLIVAMYFEDKPPFFMHDKKNNFFGLDVELANNIALKMGVKVEFTREAKTFNEILDILLQKKADVAISKISTTLDRAKKVLFSDSYLTFHQTLLIDRLACAQLKRGNDPLKILKEGNVSLGVIFGTSYVDFAKEDFPNVKLVTYPSWNALTQDVLKGKFLALLYDNHEIQNWHKINPHAAIDLQTLVMKDKNDPIAMAVHWEDKQLHSWLNHYLNQVRQNGFLDELRIKYVDNDEWRNT